MSATMRAAPGLIEGLRDQLGERVSTSPSVLEQHGRDESYHPLAAPDAVVFAETTEEVARVVEQCADRRTPVVAYGTGTSLEGHVQALAGGVCIDLGRMDAVLEVNAEDLDCKRRSPASGARQLNEYLRDTGLVLSRSTRGRTPRIGGMTATRASGTNAVRYGTMRENVLGLTVVLADGRVVRTGGRARKSAAGYDLTRLLVGSEGTLGIITELRLRLYGVPEAISSAVCAFPTLGAAVDTVILTIQSGIPVARIELLDEVQLDAVNRYSGLDYPVQPTLFFEFHGSEAGVREQVEAVGAIAGELGGGGFDWATRQEDRSRLWQARHDAYYATLAMRPGSKGWATDVCVPISRLAECIVETRRDVDESGLYVTIVGHVGDGNFHLCFALDPDDPDQMRRAEAVNERMVVRALEMGGTCTGEHGIGYGKLELLEREHGEGVSVMRAVKDALDPLGILNPGKIVRG